MLKSLCLAVAAAAIAGCAPAPDKPAFQLVTTPGQYIELVAGKPITFDNGGVLITNRDGSIGGDFNGVEPQGRWSFESGRLCRTVTIGTENFPEVCQSVEVGEETVRFLNPDGTLSAEAALG